MRSPALVLLTLLAACGGAPQRGADPEDAGQSAAPDGAATTGGLQDAGALPDAGQALTCPPAGPFGAREGDVLPDVTLPDCEGRPQRIHDLCGKKAAWLYVFAGWCPYCRQFASAADGVYARFQGPDFGALFIITEKEDGSRANAAYCRSIQALYGLEDLTVVYDDGSFAALALPVNHTHVVLAPGVKVEHRVQYRDDTFQPDLERLLAQ
jgi:hypothetical protein